MEGKNIQYNINGLDFNIDQKSTPGSFYCFVSKHGVYKNPGGLSFSNGILPLRQTSRLVPHLCLTAMKKNHPFRRRQDGRMEI